MYDNQEVSIYRALKGYKMISQLNAANVRTAYQSSEPTEKVQKRVLDAQGDTSKVEVLKKAIADGEYRVNLDKLSEVIADELLRK